LFTYTSNINMVCVMLGETLLQSCRNVLTKLRLRHEKTCAGQSSESASTNGRTYDFNKWRNDRLRFVHPLGALVATLATLLHLINCRFIIIISVIIFFLAHEREAVGTKY